MIICLMKKIKASFTLIEIIVCMAILGVISAFVGIQIRQMVGDHTFENNKTNLIAELKKCQLIAICDQVDIEIILAKEGKGYAFWIETDDDLPCFSKRKMLMTGVQRVEKDGKLLNREVIHFYPSGRFEPKTLVLFHRKSTGCVIDMRQPLMIELNPLSA